MPARLYRLAYIMGDHTGSPLQLYTNKNRRFEPDGLDRLSCFQGREYRGEKMSDAGSSHVKVKNMDI